MADKTQVGRVASLNVSQGGVPKLPVDTVWIGKLGVSGDRQKHTDIHGGPERAVCLYSLEIIQALQAEGHPISPGTTGENVTISGLDWDTIAPQVRMRLGEALIEITRYTTPCKTIRDSFTNGEFVRISQKVNPGWSRAYARVLEEGRVDVGDHVAVSFNDGQR